MDMYLTFAKYRTAIRKKEITGAENLKKFHAMLYDFLNRFDWILSYTATDISAQEKRGDKRFTGVCYDACKYLAQKLENDGIEYKAYWICGCDKKSINLWFSGQSLHGFNLCKIDGIYYFADCFFAPILRGDNYIFGFTNEKDALAWASETLLPESPFILREFNPLTVKMDDHISFSLRRLNNLKD
jgi:hypothetical protein